MPLSSTSFLYLDYFIFVDTFLFKMLYCDGFLDFSLFF